MAMYGEGHPVEKSIARSERVKTTRFHGVFRTVIMDIFPLPFSKFSGTGNDFIFIDHRSLSIPPSRQPDLVRAICRRMFSVGADGVMLIENSALADFRWRFYNSDGSLAEMCGNGARCAARFAYEEGIVKTRTMCFETLAGVVAATLYEDNSVRVQLTRPTDFREGLAVEIDGQGYELGFLNSGVPHAVLFVDEDFDGVKEMGSQIRHHSLFAPQGTNVNFVSLKEKDTLLVRTYERGVEDETRACGTGAVASAIVAARKKMVVSPVTVQTSGGDRLQIAFDMKENGDVEEVFLTGPTHLVYRGEMTAESIL